MSRETWVTVCGLLLVLSATKGLSAEEVPEGFVGQACVVRQVLIPGPRVVPTPLTQDRPNVILRITEVYPRVDSALYDFECYGLEAGQHDLRDFLQYADGSKLDDVSPILIQVNSVLPAGQIVPAPLANQRPPRLSTYQGLVVAFVVTWILGLLAILFARRRPPAELTEEPHERTLAELLKPKLERARGGALPEDEFAELERLIVEHWRRQGDAPNRSYEAARAELHALPEAGPLLAELEDWLHRPDSDRDQTLAELVAKHDRALRAVGEEA